MQRALFSKFQMFIMNKMSATATEGAYVCEKCNYTTKVKSSFIAHTTKRKIPCDAAKNKGATDAKPEAKPEPVAETKSEPVAEAKPESALETKSEAKPETKHEASTKSEPKQEKDQEDLRTRQIVINCVKLETVNRLHDAIYLFDECLKRPDPDANLLQRKQFKTLAELVQIYHELIASLQYREAAVQSLTRNA